MDRDTKVWVVTLSLVLFLMLTIASFQKNQDRLIRIAELETELSIRMEQAEKEQQEIREIQKVLLEENKELKKKLERYETLSSYIENRLLNANSITPEKAEELTTVFWDQIKLYNFEPEKAIAWIEQESEFKITAKSYKGAVGLTQIMPKIGREIAKKLGIKWEGSKTLLNPENSLKMGFYHLSWGRNNSINDHQTFSMYFWGYGNVKKKGLVETSYSASIFEKAEQLSK